jgi:hypothetical protein
MPQSGWSSSSVTSLWAPRVWRRGHDGRWLARSRQQFLPVVVLGHRFIRPDPLLNASRIS